MTGLVLVMPGGDEERIEDADDIIERFRDADGTKVTGNGAWVRVKS